MCVYIDEGDTATEIANKLLEYLSVVMLLEKCDFGPFYTLRKFITNYTVDGKPGKDNEDYGFSVGVDLVDNSNENEDEFKYKEFVLDGIRYHYAVNKNYPNGIVIISNDYLEFDPSSNSDYPFLK